MIAAHISNVHLDLTPVFWQLAQFYDLDITLIKLLRERTRLHSIIMGFAHPQPGTAGGARSGGTRIVNLDIVLTFAFGQTITAT